VCLHRPLGLIVHLTTPFLLARTLGSFPFHYCTPPPVISSNLIVLLSFSPILLLGQLSFGLKPPSSALLAFSAVYTFTACRCADESFLPAPVYAGRRNVLHLPQFIASRCTIARPPIGLFTLSSFFSDAKFNDREDRSPLSALFPTSDRDGFLLLSKGAWTVPPFFHPGFNFTYG